MKWQYFFITLLVVTIIFLAGFILGMVTNNYDMKQFFTIGLSICSFACFVGNINKMGDDRVQKLKYVALTLLVATIAFFGFLIVGLVVPE